MGQFKNENIGIGGVFEFEIIDKKTGFLVDPEDFQGIADSIIDYYHNYNEDEVAENIKKENYRFSWDLLINKIESFAKL